MRLIGGRRAAPVPMVAASPWKPKRGPPVWNEARPVQAFRPEPRSLLHAAKDSRFGLC